jgi:hypothetical protein
MLTYALAHDLGWVRQPIGAPPGATRLYPVNAGWEMCTRVSNCDQGNVGIIIDLLVHGVGTKAPGVPRMSGGAAAPGVIAAKPERCWAFFFPQSLARLAVTTVSNV